MHMITSQIRFGITTILVHKLGKGIHSSSNRFKIYGCETGSKQMKMAKHVILPQCNKWVPSYYYIFKGKQFKRSFIARREFEATMAMEPQSLEGLQF